MEELTHLHLTINAKIKNMGNVPKKRAESIVRDILEVADMKALGPLVWSDAADLDFPGQSFVQMITTSHCSLHLFSDTNEIYFDLYSCKDFNANEVINVLNSYFGLDEYHGMIYRRGNNHGIEISKIGRW
jgi:S-adenosylmethionine/arginine decarboxylase-like enzyme